MTVLHDCQAFDKPDIGARVLGKKRAGSSFYGKINGDWVSFTTRSKREVYLAKECF
jgi:hypothetical protein